ncbi:MAG TPA: ATP-binding protein [Pyrinomonadaceae bacterium]|nr:ATP-binding protein [Pyrinomonadaceae bacterium]
MNRARFFSLYFKTTVVLGAAVCVLSASRLTGEHLDPKLLLLAAMTIFFSSRIAIRIPNSSGHITVSDTFIFLTMLLYGGEPAVLLAAAEGAYSSSRFGNNKKTVAFNGLQMALSTFVTVTLLRLIFGPVRDLAETPDLRFFLTAVCFMAVVQYLVNSGLAAVYTAINRNQSIAQTWSKYYLWSSISLLAGASAAGLISRVVKSFSFYYVALTMPIILIIYLTYKTYLKNIEASAAQAEQAERERMREHYSQMEKLSALGELASGVAHNFNNTLTGILARAQLMLETDDRAEMRRGLHIIIQTAEDGAKTVKRIQDFARQRRDQLFAPIDVDRLMLEVAEITRPRWKDRAEAQNIHIRLDRQISSNAVILGDAGELREVLVNMVFNAVDAMPEGGTLTLSTRESGSDVEVCVADTGVGMTEEVRTRIFDPFFTTKGKAGMGLGLSVSYGIIRRHEGSVEVESEVGRGATFRMRFPKATGAPEPDAVTHAARLAGAVRGELRILVVDDEDYVRELLADILEREGCEVVLAAEGREALALFDGGGFDAVFTDVGLPGMSGWELARYVRERDAEIALAVITGWGDTVSPAEQTESQADWVIAKPFTIERITALVHEISQRKASQDLYAVQDAKG